MRFNLGGGKGRGECELGTNDVTSPSSSLSLLLPFAPLRCSPVRSPLLLGSEPATSKQLSFISLLQNQHPSFHLSPTKKDHLTKTEASEIIDGLKNGKEISVEGLGEEEVEGTKEKDKKEVTPSLDDDASPSKSTTTTKEDSEEKEKGGKPGTEEYLEHPETWATGESSASLSLFSIEVVSLLELES